MRVSILRKSNRLEIVSVRISNPFFIISYFRVKIYLKFQRSYNILSQRYNQKLLSFYSLNVISPLFASNTHRQFLDQLPITSRKILRTILAENIRGNDNRHKIPRKMPGGTSPFGAMFRLAGVNVPNPTEGRNSGTPALYI